MEETGSAESTAKPRNANKEVMLGLEPRSLDAKAQLLQPRGPDTSAPFLFCAITGQG